MSYETLIIGGLMGQTKSLWPLTGMLRVLHQANIDKPLINHKHLFLSERSDYKLGYKSITEYHNYLDSILISQNSYLEIKKEEATWMIHDIVTKGAVNLEHELNTIFAHFCDQSDCGAACVAQELESESKPYPYYKETLYGKIPLKDLYHTETLKIKLIGQNDIYIYDNNNSIKLKRTINFLNQNYIPTNEREKNLASSMTIGLLNEIETAQFSFYSLYDNPQALQTWLLSQPSQEARFKVAEILLTGMDIKGVKQILTTVDTTERPAKINTEAALFPIQSFLNAYQPEAVFLQAVVYSLRKAQYELETIWPDASKIFATLNEKFTQRISIPPIGLLAEQFEERLKYFAQPASLPPKSRKFV